MGEVYRARDTRLDREVAIKALPAAVRDDPERLARFGREAQVLASLNHANIGNDYDISPDGQYFLIPEVHGVDASEVRVVLNFPAELKRLATAGEVVARSSYSEFV